MFQITPEVESLIDRALTEDLSIGDPTTDALIPPELTSKAVLIAKAEGVLAGIEVALAVFKRVDPTLSVHADMQDGSPLQLRDVIATVEGSASSILKAERTALNFLQRLSGIATETSRYVRAVAIREVNSVVSAAADDTSVGGRWIVHHMIWSTRMPDLEEGEAAVEAPEGQTADTGQQQTSGQNAERDPDEENTRTGWPVHELGRNPDIFNPRAGRLLRAGSQVVSNSVHLHSNGADTRAHLEIGWYFHPVDYEPEYRRGGFSLGDGLNIDIRGGQEEYQELL